MSMNMIGHFAEQFGGQQLERASGRLNAITPYAQPLMTDSFLKSSVQKVEEFRAVFQRFQPQLAAWKAKVSINRNLFGKKNMTVNYGGNVNTIHSGRNLESALQDGEKFSQLSKSLPQGASVRSENPNQLELWLPGRESVVFTDQDPKKVFTEFYGRVPQYDYVGKPVDKFAEAQKLIEKFKANNR